MSGECPKCNGNLTAEQITELLKVEVDRHCYFCLIKLLSTFKTKISREVSPKISDRLRGQRMAGKRRKHNKQ